MTRKMITAIAAAALIIAFSIPAFAGGFEENLQSDPVLSVSAPPNAKKVTAYFPFGLIRTLRLDEVRGRWSTRVLASRQVAEGVYKVRIRVEHEGGRIESGTVEYMVDHSSPEFEVHTPHATYGGELLPIEVDPFEQAQQVYAYILGLPNKRFHFSLDPNMGSYKAMIPMPDQFSREKLVIRIVVLDRNRNYLLRAVDVYDLDLLEEHGYTMP